MKKILYIDPLSQRGHKNFNRYLIEILQMQYDVTFVFMDGYFDFMEGVEYYHIPKKFYCNNNNGLLNRFLFYRINKWIKKNISFSNYDVVLFASSEEISFSLSGFEGDNIYVLNHDLSGFDNIVKRFFIKYNARKVNYVYLDEYIKSAFDENCITNAYLIKHPLVEPFLSPDEKNESEYIIFSPSLTSSDFEFVNHLLNDKGFNGFLEDNNIKLIIKGNLETKSSNVSVIKGFIDDYEYRRLFLKANVILLPYENKFKYRVSGILFEAMVNEKPILMKKCDGLDYYTRRYDKVIRDFVDLDGLKKAILESKLIVNVEKEQFSLFKDEYSKENILKDIDNAIRKVN